MILTVLLAIGAGLAEITLSLDAEHASATALNTYIPASNEAEQLLASMVDQESGERGYVITAQPRFLQPYDAGRRETASLVGQLRDDLRSDAAAESALRRAVARYMVWLHTFAVPQIADVKQGDVRAAIAAEKTGKGKTLFDALRTSSARLESLITRREVSAADRIKSLQQEVVWLIVGLLVCAVAGSVLGYRLLRRWIIRPIRALERSVVSASRDDAIAMASGPVEITSLGVSIEVMRNRIRDQAAELGEQQHVVNVLQEALLPRRLPEFEGFEFAARYLPAPTEAGFGGDWYNVRQAGPSRLFVAVGDVVGKGVGAAALMSSLRFAIDAFALEDPDPGRVLTRLSNLVALADTDRFATVVACLFDAEGRVTHLASAGHPRPIQISARASLVLPVVPGPPIGLGPTLYETATVPFPTDATVLLFSDGLVERRTEPLDESVERLIGLATPRSDLDPLVDRLVSAGNADRSDDTIICGVRALGRVARRAVRTERRFAPAADSVSAARHFVTHAVDRLPVETVADVELIVSELVTNALMYTAAAFEVSVETDVDRLLVTVTDHGAGTPTMRTTAEPNEHGRGLVIVDRLAGEWGVMPCKNGTGKAVWFCVDLDPDPSTRAGTSSNRSADRS